MTNAGQFKQGNAGKPKGAVSKTTKQFATVRDAVLQTFMDLQEDPNHNLEQFAKKHPKEFHAIAAKLIPTDIKATVATQIQLTIKRGSTGRNNAAGFASGAIDGIIGGEEV